MIKKQVFKEESLVDKNILLEPKFIVFLTFIMIYSLLLVYNIINSSLWAIDSCFITIIFCIFFYYSYRLGLGAVSVFFFGLSVLMHNLGTFNAYSVSILGIMYDKWVHLTSAISGTVILSKIFYTKIFYYEDKKINKNLLIFFFVIAIAMFLGVVTEFVEFSGYNYFGAPWPGMFSPMDSPSTILNHYYIDTMQDLFTDLIGALIGTVGYILILKK